MWAWSMCKTGLVKSCGTLFLSLITLSATAAPGNWNATKPGVALTYRGQVFSSPAFSPSPGQGVSESNLITVIYWRYAIDGPFDPGMRVKLCNPQRCTDIDGGSGQTQAFSGLPATSPFTFVYSLDGRGRVDRPINVREIAIAVNYQ